MSFQSPYLLISQEEVIHVNHGNHVPILMIVQNESNLLKVQFHIKFGRLVVQCMIHSNLET
jgi:hypothetical protein